MVRILVVDDHALIREGLKQIVAEAPGLRVAGEAATGREALAKIRDEDYDVVLLDISLPDMSGMEVLKETRRRHPELPVLVLTIHPEDQYAIRALRAGAAGYLTKNGAPEELVEALRKVAEGGKYASPWLSEHLISRLDADFGDNPHESLSDREYQVLCMIASGKRVKEIGAELSLSPKTISTYRTRVLEKMGLKHNAELTRYALEQGLVG